MSTEEYSNIRIRAEDLDCVSEMALDLEMELIDFISLLVSDAAKTILTPTLPSLCQIIVSRRLSLY